MYCNIVSDEYECKIDKSKINVIFLMKLKHTQRIGGLIIAGLNFVTFSHISPSLYRTKLKFQGRKRIRKSKNLKKIQNKFFSCVCSFSKILNTFQDIDEKHNAQILELAIILNRVSSISQRDLKICTESHNLHDRKVCINVILYPVF